MIGSLIYYSDTYAFFDKHYDEIHDLLIDLKDTGLEIPLPDDIKNHFAWMAFEEKAYQLSIELGLEI